MIPLAYITTLDSYSTSSRSFIGRERRGDSVTYLSFTLLGSEVQESIAFQVGGPATDARFLPTGSFAAHDGVK